MDARVQIRRLFRVVNGGTPAADSDNWGGEVRWVTPEDLGSAMDRYLTVSRRTLTSEGQRAAAPLVPPGSLLLSTRAPIGHIGIVGAPLSFNQGCRALVPRIDLDSRYFYWQLIACRAELQAAGQGSTFVELSGAALAGFRVHAPSINRQRATADFLDAETARIDALVRQRIRQSELLAERQRVACRLLVTGGDFPYPVGPLRRWWSVIDCKHRTPDYVSAGVPLISTGEVEQGRLALERTRRFVSDEDYEDLAAPPRRPRRGDLIYSRNASLGASAYVDTDDPFCMGQDVC